MKDCDDMTGRADYEKSNDHERSNIGKNNIGKKEKKKYDKNYSNNTHIDRRSKKREFNRFVPELKPERKEKTSYRDYHEYLEKIKNKFEDFASEVSIMDRDKGRRVDLLDKHKDGESSFFPKHKGKIKGEEENEPDGVIDENTYVGRLSSGYTEIIDLKQIPNFDLNKNLRKNRRRYFVKAIITIVIFTIIYMIIARAIFSVFYGSYNGPYYFSEDILLTGEIIVYVLVILLIIRKAIYSAFSYIREVVYAMEKVYDDSNTAIVLNSDLREVEYRLNTIKMELKESKNAAIDAEKRKNDLIMYLAHDLKTPLTSIIGFLGILRDEKLLPDSFKEKYTEICYDKATRLEDLINEFFEITRFGINKIELEKSKVDMSMMMEQFVSEFEPIARKNSLTLSSSIEKGVSLYVDVGKMERVFDNLLRNAISYSYNNSTIAVSMFTRNGEFFFEVCNSGKIIPPEKLERLFEEFFRVDSSRSTKTGNAGLGLTISKSIVEAHGGKIIATSEDEITKMSVRLPMEVNKRNRI